MNICAYLAAAPAVICLCQAAEPEKTSAPFRPISRQELELIDPEYKSHLPTGIGGEQNWDNCRVCRLSPELVVVSIDYGSGLYINALRIYVRRGERWVCLPSALGYSASHGEKCHSSAELVGSELRIVNFEGDVIGKLDLAPWLEQIGQ